MDDNQLEATLERPYTIAEGPEGLRQVLDTLLEQSKNSQKTEGNAYYILYQLGGQKSVIKVDMDSKPIKFWYNDLLGRPATRAVKKTIALFLIEKCGEKAEDLQDLLGEIS